MQRTLRTLAFLQPRQALNYLKQRGLGPSRVAPVEDALKRHIGRPAGWLIPSAEGCEPWEFQFLNHGESFAEGEVDWQPEAVSRLWRYNLHYFAYLADRQRPHAVKQAMLDHWIEHNPQLSRPAWEPYTTSLRICNWIKYFIDYPSAATEPRLVSLHTQARWLRRNLERHILANHYFENIKALLFAGTFLHGLEADGWRKFAQKELAKQLREQTLADGCHYERTPAYHCLMVQNYLDLYGLMEVNPALFDAGLTAQLRETASAGLGFLADILLPGDRIPLFNDSAFDSAPVPGALFAYAARLDVAWQTAAQERVVDLPDAGIYGYVGCQDGILVDCGEIGPAYQPGHTHCDFLSYELILDGLPLVVDTGVSEYEPGEARDYVRSTRAHNTVSVGGDEQSEIWGEFRVARRARKLSASIESRGDGVEFDGSYRGFYGLGGKVRHQRKLGIALAGSAIAGIDIEDTIYNARTHQSESFIHFHPEVVLERQEEGRLLMRQGDHRYAVLIGEACTYALSQSVYCPEFGRRQANLCITLTTEATSPAIIRYKIQKIP